MNKFTRRQAMKCLRERGWVRLRDGLWRTEKQGIKRHTVNGLTFREAASIEGITFVRNT